MKKIFLMFLGVLPFVATKGQSETDTLYYDKEWKVVSNKAFAEYFRVFPVTDDSVSRKPYRDYYITGELQSEGGYITIDVFDDSNSVFDGESTLYYKSGKIEQKLYWNRGRQEGEYIRYAENGLVLLHANMKDDKYHGLYTQFSEDGNLCIQMEYRDGEPLYDYYMLSNNEGLCSKIRLSDKQPIYDAPLLSEKQTEYRNGQAWPYYNKNGILVGMTNTMVKDYGKYFQISIIISNNSMFPIVFDPDGITASLTDQNGTTHDLKVLSSYEYMKKVTRQQNWAMAMNGFAEGMAAYNAGYSTSTTNSSYRGSSSTYGRSSTYGNASAYGSGGYAYGNYYGNTTYSGNTYYSGSSTSTTRTYDGAAAYQAQVIANNRAAAYNNALLSERAAKDEGYLKRMTIHPGQTIQGYVNIQRRKGTSMDIRVYIQGVAYPFSWNISR